MSRANRSSPATEPPQAAAAASAVPVGRSEQRKKGRRGVRPAPENLPDGPWKRKLLKEKRLQIAQSQTRRAYAKLKRDLKREEAERRKPVISIPAGDDVPPVGDGNVDSNSSMHPDRAARLQGSGGNDGGMHPERSARLMQGTGDDGSSSMHPERSERLQQLAGRDGGANVASGPGRERGNQGKGGNGSGRGSGKGKGKSSRSDMRSRLEEEALRRREERERTIAEKERRRQERERLRRVMAKAKGYTRDAGGRGKGATGGGDGQTTGSGKKGRIEKPAGKRKLGRESIVLLEKVKKLMGKT